MKKGTLLLQVLFFLLCLSNLVFVSGKTIAAGLDVSGIFLSEIVSDPLNFDPTIARTSPRRSEDQGGLIKPGLYVGHFTKLGLQLQYTDDRVEAYLPLTVRVDPFTNPSWQAYLVADDLLNIPYYFTLEGDVFNYSVSSRPVGDKKYGFQDFQDYLGVVRIPNSNNPIFTLRVSAAGAESWSGSAYILFDQLVEGIPIWELIPQGEEQIGNEMINFGNEKRLVKDVGFIDELAQYNLLNLSKTLFGGINLRFIWGQKHVTNPAFRLIPRGEKNSSSEILVGWGYLKENYGLEFNKESDKIGIRGSVFKGSVEWRKYVKDPEVGEGPSYYKRWYPYDDKGTLAGDAAFLGMSFKGKQRKLHIDLWHIDPAFQAVAPMHSQFVQINRFPNQYESEEPLKIKAQMLFDPKGKLTGVKPEGSIVIDYLGKKVMQARLEQTGKLGSWPVQLSLQTLSVLGIDDINDKYLNPVTGAEMLKDFQETQMSLEVLGNDQNLLLTFSNRDYYSDYDYLLNLSAVYEHRWSSSKLVSTLEKAYCLRNDAGFGEGTAFRASSVLGMNLPSSISLSFSFDYRAGTYDFDLLYPSNQVTHPYTYLGLEAYIEKKQSFMFAGNKAEFVMAGEFINNKTDLDGLVEGKSIVGFLNLDLPCNNFRFNSTILGVGGIESEELPSGNLKTTIHQELNYSPRNSKYTLYELGYTLRPTSKRQNIYAGITTKLAKGNFSITYGQRTLPLSDNQIVFAGSFRENINRKGYSPASVLRGKPWQIWDDGNLYKIWDDGFRPTDQTWENYISVRYWFSF